MGEMAVIGDALAAELARAGFEIVSKKNGKVVNVYYFNDSIELQLAIEELVKI